MDSNSTSADKPYLGKPQFQSHTWVEPIIVLSIMLASLYFNRRRGFSILRKNPNPKRIELGDSSEEDERLGASEERVPFFRGESLSSDVDTKSPKARNCLGLTVKTPNSARFAKHIHSRILQRFPFLVEMFYWALNYLFYACTKATAQALSPPDISVVEVAQEHGIWVLHTEHETPIIKWFYPIREADFQWFLLANHPSIMTFFNRIYSLVHIPGTVAFLSWYYYMAPDHASFAAVRRTMTLGNFSAFITFCFWPCMPPRLLPESFGFHDTVRQEHAESVWVGGKNVNQLAAMPSLHFTYAFCIGSTFIWHSGILQHVFGKNRMRLTWTDFLLVATGIFYPLLVLSVIVATANHYWMDATVAMFTTALSFLCNRIWIILLPLEDWLLWAWRLEKPVPTTGDRAFRKYGRRRRNGRGPQSDIEYTAVS